MMATRMEAKGRFLYEGNSGLRAQLKLLPASWFDQDQALPNRGGLRYAVIAERA
jgi:hypothetical protein